MQHETGEKERIETRGRAVNRKTKGANIQNEKTDKGASREEREENREGERWRWRKR